MTGGGVQKSEERRNIDIKKNQTNKSVTRVVNVCKITLTGGLGSKPSRSLTATSTVCCLRLRVTRT
jgi:hypothetical protein